MSKMAKNLIVMLVAVLMFFSSAMTAVEAKGSSTGWRPQPTEEPIVEPEPEATEEEAEEEEEAFEEEEIIEETEEAAEEAPAEEAVVEEEEPEETDLSAEIAEIVLGPVAEINEVSSAPATSKQLYDNGDGTYTLALSVTGAAESSSSTTVTKANVILVLDTSNSMSSNNTTYNGQSMSRMNAEKKILTEDDGIVDQMLAKNTSTYSDIIEIAIVDFGQKGVQQLSFSTNATTIKNKINGLTTTTGTNWEEALQKAKNYADSVKATQPDEDVYIIFMTDGEPTTHENSYNTQNNTTGYQTNWTYASDDARAIVTAGYKFYGIFTWGSSSSSKYLSSLVQYAYTGTGNYNSSLSSDYEDYFKDATDSDELVSALTAIINEISSNTGYTNVELDDEVTSLTASNLSSSVSGTVDVFKYYRSGGSYSTTANNGLGEEWTDAPEATVEDGKVNWDLDDIVLEDGVTYTITFVVWPSQESLDLVADLNNGLITYDSLTDAQKESIVVSSGGTYSLKTNTDYPTVTYSTTTTTIVNGEETTVVSDPVTVNITNPGPVGLLGQKITLEKKWDDSLDPSQREEEVDSVVLDLYEGSTVYIEDIELNAENSWILENWLSIAPGILITEDSPAYRDGLTAVTYDGTTYYILEEGHDYKFQEDDINNHFELTAYEYHPMIIGNEVKNVTFTYDDEGNITGIEKIEDMSSISATNTLKGGINLIKKVVDENGNEVDTDDTFTVVMHMQNPDGTDYNYDYRIYYGEHNPAGVAEKDEDGNITGYGRSDHIYGSGDAEVTFYVGDTVRFVNVDAGTLYYATEDDSKITYTLKGITYQISTGSTESYADYDEDDTVTANDVTWYTMKGNSACSVVVTNTHPGFFYVYHSSDNMIEKISLSDSRVVNGKFNIVNETKSGYIYGGYFKAYGGQKLDDAGIRALTYDGEDDKSYEYVTNHPAKANWATDTDATAYTGAKATAWKKANAYTTVKGTEMAPAKDGVYYLKEVPDSYLRPYIQIVYDYRTSPYQVKKLFRITATDDANYTEVGFYDGSADASVKKLSSTIKITNEYYPSKSVTLTAKKVFNGKAYDDKTVTVPRGYLISIQNGIDADFDMRPYFKTLDGVKVYGVTNRTVKPGDKTYVAGDGGVGVEPGITVKDATSIKACE